MNWNKHKELEGTHAFLGASNYHWLNYSEDTFRARFVWQYATIIGTAIHELASDLIKHRIEISENDKNLIDITLQKLYIPRSAYDANQILNNLIPFVNDSIGYHMDSEVLLFYSRFCYGTADAIGYNDIDKILRINDYKSGNIPAHMEQLLIYAALFCLEYNKHPSKLKGIELRIYQGGEVLEYFPDADTILTIMDKIKKSSELASILYGSVNL